VGHGLSVGVSVGVGVDSSEPQQIKGFFLIWGGCWHFSFFLYLFYRIGPWLLKFYNRFSEILSKATMLLVIQMHLKSIQMRFLFNQDTIRFSQETICFSQERNNEPLYQNHEARSFIHEPPHL